MERHFELDDREAKVEVLSKSAGADALLEPGVGRADETAARWLETTSWFRGLRPSVAFEGLSNTPPSLWYLLEQPLYVGERTTWLVSIDSLPFILRPTAPAVIGRCEIRGCVDGASPSYCRLDGSHVCEDKPGS